MGNSVPVSSPSVAVVVLLGRGGLIPASVASDGGGSAVMASSNDTPSVFANEVVLVLDAIKAASPAPGYKALLSCSEVSFKLLYRSKIITLRSARPDGCAH